MARRRLRSRSAAALLVLSVIVLGSLTLPASARAAAAPPLPIGDGAILMGNLSSASLTPGESGAVSFTVVDPLSVAIADAVATFDVYAFNAFPGNATSTVAVSGAPLLSNDSASASEVSVSIGGLGPGARYAGSVGVATSDSTPSGAFAVRTALNFTANGTAYRLASRGWFTAAQWAAATELPNGSLTLNLSELGVSGVLPETSIVVASSPFPWILAGLAAAGVLLVGAGAWVYFRRESSSRSGTRSAGPEK